MTFDHFSAKASTAEKADSLAALVAVVDLLEIAQDGRGNGYRIVMNASRDGVQEVPHLYFQSTWWAAAVSARCCPNQTKINHDPAQTRSSENRSQ